MDTWEYILLENSILRSSSVKPDLQVLFISYYSLIDTYTRQYPTPKSILANTQPHFYTPHIDQPVLINIKLEVKTANVKIRGIRTNFKQLEKNEE